MTLQCALYDNTQLVFGLDEKNDDTFIDVADNVNGVYPGFEPKYILTSQGNTWTLTILNAQDTDGRQYRCRQQIGNANAYAEVIVLGMLYVSFTVLM